MIIIKTPAIGNFNIVYWGGQQEVKVGKEHDDFIFKSLLMAPYFAINSERQLIEYQNEDGTFFRVPHDFFFAVNGFHLLTTIKEEGNK